jgi:Bacterial extracellular solute-binding proteins, family 3
MKNWLTLAAIGLGALTAVVVAQSSTGSSTPSRIKTAGELVFCTEVGYPPFEFFPEGSNKPSGFDIDLGNELALRLGVRPRWENVGFDGIIASLQSKKCDAIIAGLGATDKRREQVDFVLYLQNNRALVVRKGNPKKVSSFDALCGLTIGAQIGSANYDDMLKRAETCKAPDQPDRCVQHRRRQRRHRHQGQQGGARDWHDFGFGQYDRHRHTQGGQRSNGGARGPRQADARRRHDELAAAQVGPAIVSTQGHVMLEQRI